MKGEARFSVESVGDESRTGRVRKEGRVRRSHLGGEEWGERGRECV